jgi:diguanylate cyclase (GGDEF)-like protein
MTSTARWTGPAGLLIALLMVGGMAGAENLPIHFERISVDEGLSQATVLTMLQDRAGFMWFGTEDGLNRFDGHDFRIYGRDPSSPGSLVDDYVVALAEDPDGDLWVATQNGGVGRWIRSSDSFEIYRHDPEDPTSIPSDHVRTLVVDRDGRVWIGTRDSGLAVLDRATGAVTVYRHDPGDHTSLSDDHVFAVVEDSSGHLWVGTDGGLNRLDPISGSFTRYLSDPDNPWSLSDDRVRAVTVGRDQLIWIGTSGGGLNRLDPSIGKFTSFRHDPNERTSLSHDRIRSLFEDESERLWVGTIAGLNLLHRETATFSRYVSDDTSPVSLPGNDVWSVYQDRGGILWVGTQFGGIGKWNSRSWFFGHHTVDPSDETSLNHKIVTAFTEDRGGRLWVGTFGGGINVLDRSNGRFSFFTHDSNSSGGLASNRVMALLRDRHNAIWIGTMDAGLQRFDPARERFTSYTARPDDERSLSANGVMSLFEDGKGNLWVGTFGGGLDRYLRESDSFSHFPHDPDGQAGPASPRVTCIGETSDGALWLGTDGGGLSRFDPLSETWLNFKDDPNDATSLGSNSVFSMHVDSTGRLWVGTLGGGLVTLEDLSTATGDATFSRYTVSDGLTNNVIYGIQPDGEGNLWLSTNRGLSRFDPSTATVENYTHSHGLQDDEFNFGAHFRSPSGELAFGGVNGFNLFFSSRLQRSTQPPPVVLTKIELYGSGIEPRSETRPPVRLDLGYREDIVTLEFVALDFTSPEENTYKYKLDGFNKDWVDNGNHRRATFTNLDAGRYVFRVQAANSDGVESVENIEIPINVAPAPWETWWARVIYLLLLGGLVWALWRAQQRRLQREEDYSRKLKLEVDAQTTELAMKNSTLEEMNTKLLEASLTDPLTGLRNRRFLFEHVTKDIAFVRRRHSKLKDEDEARAHNLAFMMIDLDYFKKINDTFGHQVGDRVLLEVRDVFLRAVRDSDIVIRWGGDEFLIVARDCDPEKAKVLAERIRSNVAACSLTLPDNKVVEPTCSIGFACYPFVQDNPDHIDWEQVLTLADAALYEAKLAHRNQWFGFLSTPWTAEIPDPSPTIKDDARELVKTGHLRILSSSDPGPNGAAEFAAFTGRPN